MLGVIALAVCLLPLSKTTANAEDVVDITDNVSASGWVTQSELKVTYLNLGDNVVPIHHRGVAYSSSRCGYHHKTYG